MSVHVSSRAGGPFGWEYGGRRQLHYHTVLPTSKSSMHLNMTRNLTPRLKAASQLKQPNGLASALITLDKNRLPPKRFNGIKKYNSGQVRDVSERLALYNTQLKPAEGKGKFPQISQPCEHEAKRQRPQKDIDEMCSRLSAPKINEQSWKRPPSKKINQNELTAIVDRLHKYDPQSHPADSKGIPARSRSYSDLRGPQRSLTREESRKLIERLATYDSSKTPADSPGQEEIPLRRQSGRYKERDIDEIVERLTTYNKKNWPAESVGTREPWADGHHWNFKRTKTMA